MRPPSWPWDLTETTNGSQHEVEAVTGNAVEVATGEEAEAVTGNAVESEIAVEAVNDEREERNLGDESRPSTGMCRHLDSSTSHPCSTRPCRPPAR